MTTTSVGCCCRRWLPPASAWRMMAIMLWPGGTPWPEERINVWFLVPATIVEFIFGRRFLVAAARGLPHADLNMNTLVAMGTLAAYGYSLFVTLFPEAVASAGLGMQTYFDSAALIIGLILLGRWLEARAKSQAAGAVKALLKLRPSTARVIRNGVELDLPVDQVRVDDLLRVPTRRQGPGRRRPDRWRLRPGRVDADRRIAPRREGRGRSGHRVRRSTPTDHS